MGICKDFQKDAASLIDIDARMPKADPADFEYKTLCKLAVAVVKVFIMDARRDPLTALDELDQGVMSHWLSILNLPLEPLRQHIKSMLDEEPVLKHRRGIKLPRTQAEYLALLHEYDFDLLKITEAYKTAKLTVRTNLLDLRLIKRGEHIEYARARITGEPLREDRLYQKPAKTPIRTKFKVTAEEALEALEDSGWKMYAAAKKLSVDPHTVRKALNRAGLLSDDETLHDGIFGQQETAETAA